MRIFLVSFCHVTRNTLFSHSDWKTSELPLWVYKKVIFGERVLHSLSSPTPPFVGPHSHAPHFARGWPVMLEVSSYYL